MRIGAAVLAAVLGMAAGAARAQEGGGGAPAGDGPWKEPARTAEILAMLKDRESAVRAAGVREAAGNPDPALVAPLARLLGDADREVRLAAIGVLVARPDEKSRKSAAGALGERLQKLAGKGEAEERMALVQGLHDLAQPSSLKGLLDGVDMDTSREEVEARLMAAGNLPCKEAVEELIQFAAARGRGQNRGWNAGLRKALAYATRYDAGTADPDVWRNWWRNHEKEFDPAAAAADRQRERDEAAEKERLKKEAQERREKGREKPDRRKDGGGKKGGGEGGGGGGGKEPGDGGGGGE